MPEIRETTPTQATLLESLDDGAGWRWRVTMVRPGMSQNRNFYSPDVLREAVQLYEGARSFDGHRLDQMVRNSSPVSGSNPLVGWHEDVAARDDGALESTFVIARSAPGLRDLFVAAYEGNRPDLIGFSHDVSAETEATVIEGVKAKAIRKITGVHSVDVVANPSAGGRLERLVASRQEENGMTPEELIELLAGNDDLAAAARDHLATASEDAEPETTAAAELPPVPAEPQEPAQEEEEPVPAGSTTESVTEAITVAPGSFVHRLMVKEAIADAKLPAKAAEKLTEQLVEAGVTDEATIAQRVAETKSIWDDAMGAASQPLPGQRGRVEVTADERTKLQHALDGMIMGRTIEGQAPFQSVKEAYSAFTGRHPYSMGDADFNRAILAEAVGAVASPSDRLTESLTSGSWAEALGDSITRALIAEYNLPDLQTWRQIVSEVGPITDFRTNRRVRVGGYDVLPTVAEGGPYTALTSPTDEEATFAIAKKGGTEDYTLETVANDDLGALRRIPRNLGQAAALTLYRAIWNDTIAANAVIYDAVALFAAGHNNDTATLPLDEAGIETVRTKMVRQTRLGETSGFLAASPRFLVVPPELYVTAFKLTQSGTSVVGAAESATTPNAWQGLVPIEVPTLADTNDWFMVADPNRIPTIEVGFYQGRQDPELLVQDQPAVGSVFTNDKITWKIRHIWGLTVLDYRGFQRATQI